LPLALPHPGFKTGTFYLAQKRNFLLCVDTKNLDFKNHIFSSGISPSHAAIPE
jgi:hypothetical protein